MKAWLLLAWGLLIPGCDKLFSIDPVSGTATADAVGAQLAFTQAYSGNVGSATSISIPFAQPPAAHDLIVVAVSTFHNTLDAIGVTDSAGNTYLRTPVNPVISQGHSQLWIVYATDITTTTPFHVDVATTLEGGAMLNDGQVSAVVDDYTGAPGARFDQSNSKASGTSSMPINQDCGQVTTTFDRELYFAAVTHDFTGMTTAGSGYTLRRVAAEDHVQYATLATEDKLEGAESTSAAFSSSWSVGAIYWACGLTTFRY